MKTIFTFCFLRAFISQLHNGYLKIAQDSTGTFIASCVLCLVSFSLHTSAQTYPTLHDYSAATIYGDTINLSRYYGKKVMVVNTASYCGYTPEFTVLENLYTLYHSHNFEIIGFPCNDFGGQDPYSDSTINAFCTGTYSVNFQMMSKVAIVSHDTAPVYKWLQRKSLNGVADAAVAWNFNKYLVDEAGHWVRHYLSPVSPMDTSIINWILSPSVLPPAVKIEFPFHEDNLDIALITPPAHPATLAEMTDKRIVAGPVWIASATTVETGIATPLKDMDWIQLKSPNPSGSAIEFEMDKSIPEKISIRMYSAEGRLIANIYEGVMAGKQVISYPVSSLPSGIYLINIQGQNVQRTIRYVVAH